MINKNFKIRYLIYCISVFCILSFQKGVTPLVVEVKQVKSGESYTIFHKGQLNIDFMTKRPSRDDKNIYLCIPGAFTTLDSLKIDGFYISNGVRPSYLKVNHGIGGGIIFENGTCRIIPTKKGKLVNDSLAAPVIKSGGSFFQQIQLIENGKGASFKDKALFQRRAIVTFKNKDVAVIENKSPVTLATFTKDLLELGAWNALYVDMGAWDEGWYRSNGEIKTIGMNRSQTKKQTNWVVFTEFKKN